MLIERIPVMDCRRQSAELSEILVAVLRDVVSSGWYLGGAQTEEFEREFSAACSVSEAICVGNGTDALEVGLRALGVERGDEVCTVANAGGYTSFACAQIGAVPVYVDIDPLTLLMCSESLARMITEQTRVIVATHLYGQPCDIETIKSVIGTRPIAILEDCAQSHGAFTTLGPVGSLGTLAAFSFYPTKNLGALGDAGAILTNCSVLAKRVRALRQYGWTERFKATVSGGRNSRIDELQAAVLRVKLPHLIGWNSKRCEIIQKYRLASDGTELTIVPTDSLGAVGHLCVARHPRRNVMRKALSSRGVETGIHYPILDPDQTCFQEVQYRSDNLVHTRQALAEIVTLPCFPELKDDEVDFVCQQIREGF